MKRINNNIKKYDFVLPQSLIAQTPAKPPDTCQLLVLDRKKKKIIDEKFLNLTNYLQKGDVLVFNNSQVIPARLIGKKETGGKVEILLLKQLKPDTWECLVGKLPLKKQIGTKIYFVKPGSRGATALAENSGIFPQNCLRKSNPPFPSSRRPLTKTLTGKILSKDKGTAQIQFNLSGKNLMSEIFKIGQMPTPPYVKRIAKNTEYQNFFADPKKLGSVAAPTAGLHFTPRMFKKLKQKGVQIEYVTLHVGLGTFSPIKEDDITKHQIHSEYFELDKQTAQRLNTAKKEGRRIIAVGTTSVRVLETCALPKAQSSRLRALGFGLRANSGHTNIYIYPPYKFKFVDSIITNFHLPKSSLLLLISAFADTNFIQKTYQHAIKKKYRFYSFGDVMMIK